MDKKNTIIKNQIDYILIQNITNSTIMTAKLNQEQEYTVKTD